jgi:glycosyltransferase involved in cell wall biosynthesis
MRVALVTHEFPPFIFGGIGIFSQNLSQALAKQGVEIVVIAGSAEKHSELKRTDGMKLMRLPRGTLPPRPLWFQLRNMSNIAKEIATCDVIHGQDIASFPMLNFCKRIGLKAPWVMTFHTNPFAQLRLSLASIHKGASLLDFATHVAAFPLWDLTVRSHARRADRLISVSESLRHELCRTYGIEKNRMGVVYPCVNVSELRALAGEQTKKSPGAEINLLYAGRLYYGKGILHLLAVVQFLTRKLGVSNFHLQIFGHGPLEEPLRRYLSTNNLGERVTFRGQVPHARLLAYVSRCDILCLPSLYESCSIIMIEAMAMAKPVVAFDLPFAREILGKNCTALLARDNVDFAQKLADLIQHQSTRNELGRLTQSKAADYDATKIASQYKRVYDSMLG